MHHDDASSRSSPKNIANKTYNTDIERTFNYSRMLLEILGLWPIITNDTTTRGKKYFSKFLILTSPIALTFPIVPTVIHIITRENDLIARLVLFAPIGFLFTNLLKYIFIVLRVKTIRLCMERMKNDWMTIVSDEDREIITRNVNVGRRLTIIAGLFMYIGGMSLHTIVPLLSGKRTMNGFNVTVRPLVYPGFDIFIDTQSSPNYEIIFCASCVSAFVAYTVFTASCNLAALFVTHACGQLGIVMSRLGSLIDDIDVNQNIDQLHDRISFIVKCHSRVLRLSSRTERVLREICLVEVASSTLIMCILEYCMMDWNNMETVVLITYVVLLVSLCFNLFIFCHIGELLKEHCDQVGRATYMTKWYRLPGKTGLALVMIIAMANYPRKITAGGMMELTISSYGDIIKTSIVYMKMLQTVAN